MREGPIKVIEIDFALEGELMEKVEQVDGCCGLWIKDCCWPESESEEVGGDVDIDGLSASAVINVDGVDSVCVEDG